VREENFAVSFLGTQFQAQDVYMTLLRKSGPLGRFWTRNLLKERLARTEAKLGEI
jgi:hypothetical protein